MQSDPCCVLVFLAPSSAQLLTCSENLIRQGPQCAIRRYPTPVHSSAATVHKASLPATVCGVWSTCTTFDGRTRVNTPVYGICHTCAYLDSFAAPKDSHVRVLVPVLPGALSPPGDGRPLRPLYTRALERVNERRSPARGQTAGNPGGERGCKQGPYSVQGPELGSREHARVLHGRRTHLRSGGPMRGIWGLNGRQRTSSCSRISPPPPGVELRHPCTQM